MRAQAMPYHGPGWFISVPVADSDFEDDSNEYQLWAPRPASSDAIGNTWKERPHWAAHWGRRGGHDGNFRRADTAEEALACFPNDPEARRAKALLLEISR